MFQTPIFKCKLFRLTFNAYSLQNTLRTVMKTPPTILINLATRQIKLSDWLIKLGSSILIAFANVINICGALSGLLKCKLQWQWRCIIIRANVRPRALQIKLNQIQSYLVRLSPSFPEKNSDGFALSRFI